MKLTKKIISLVLVVALLVSVLCISSFSVFAATNPYSDAAMQLDKDYAYSGELGAIYSPESTEFKVWSPLASDVKLNLFATGSDKEEGAENLGQYDMTKLMDEDEFTGVWTYTYEGDAKGIFYTYTITQPKSIIGGDEVTHETQDIYSYAVGINGDRTMVVDKADLNPEGWEEDNHVFVKNQTDASIWEIHVRDFSYSESSGVSEENRGKYMAFTELGTTLNDEGDIPTCVDYLKNLGITHVEINPFYDFGSIDETAPDTDAKFNWGYDPKNYGVPEGSYSSNPYDGYTRVLECKKMIQALHEAGIGVIMDVVYNHTYSIDSCFNYSVPEYYYRMTSTGAYSQQSGCGNDTASERFMYRKYMREMLSYWANEYHIDGYRFDLMGIHDCETMNLIREDMDKINTGFIILGEGWGGDTTTDPTSCTGEVVHTCTQTNSAFADSRIGFFNDVIRDGIKGGVFDGPTAGGFVSGSQINSPKVCSGIRANSMKKNQNWNAQAPTQTVTYASCHDNNTLYDKLVNINEGLGTDYRVRYKNAVAQNKLAAAIVKTSQGIDFMLAGEEMLRSKDGDENSYKSLSSENMIDWNLLKTNADVISYYKGLLELRKTFSPFTATTKDEEDDSFQYNWVTSYSSPSRHIAYTIDNTKEGEWSKISVIFNGQANERAVSLKSNSDPSVDENTEWVVIVNDESAGISKLGELKGTEFTVAPHSALIMVEKSTYEECAFKSKYASVKIKNITTDDEEVYSQYDLKGQPGEKYFATSDESVPIKYEYSHVEGDEEGTFTNETQEVKYYFDLYVPEKFTPPYGDVNDDGNVDILDASLVQKYLAKLVTLDEEHIERGDYDCDGDTNVQDAVRLQKYLAHFEVSVFTVTTNHLYDNGTKVINVSPSETKEYRVGQRYETSSVKKPYYTLLEEPTNKEGIVSKNTTVDYYYDYQERIVTIHVKHSGDLTWTPVLWAWTRNQDTKEDTPIYASWPGMPITNVEDGWNTIDITLPANSTYCLIISNNGTPQTQDYVNYDYDDCWVVIDDGSGLPNKGDWIKIYNHNPYY